MEINRRIIVKNILALFSGSVLAQGMTAITLLITARQIGPTSYGQYSSTLLLAGFTSIIFSLGLDVWLLRESGRNPSRLPDFFGSIVAIKIVLGVVWFSLMTMFANFIQLPQFPTNLLRLSMFVVWFDSLFATILTVFKSKLLNRINAILEVISDFFWLLVTFWLISIGVSQPETYMQARFGVLSISLIFSLYLAIKMIRIRFRKTHIKNTIKDSPPYASSELLTWAYLRLDVFIVSLMLGDYWVGIYSPAVGVANALLLLPASVYSVVLPVLSSLFAKNTKQAWRFGKRSLVIFLLIGILLCLGTLFITPLLVSFLGEGYQETKSILEILSFMLLIHSVNFGLAAVLVATRLQAKRSIVQALAVILNGTLNLIIINTYGIQGVAVVYGITGLVLLIGYAWIIWRNQSQFIYLIKSSHLDSG